MNLPQSEINEVALLMATGKITPAEIALARRTIHGAETAGENPRGVLLLDDLTYQWMDSIESYRNVMRVHQAKRGSVQFRYIGSPNEEGIPATLKVIERIHRHRRH